VELKALLPDEKVKVREVPIKTYAVLAEFAIPETTNDLPPEISTQPQSTETQSRKVRDTK